MNTEKKRVLIGIDGSIQSLNAASYISEILPPERTRVVLFYVDAEILDLYFDIEDKPTMTDLEKASCKEWMDMRTKNMSARLEKTKDIFLAKGFPKDHVTYIRRELAIGVTRDIIEESHKGYDLLVVGKTGTRCVTGIPMGSVTGKLISRVFHLPVVVVEGRPSTEKILVGFDNSKGSIHAANNVISFVRGTHKIMLCHVIRSMDPLNDGEFDLFSSSMNSGFPEFELQRINKQKLKLEKAMTLQKEAMEKAGIPVGHVETCTLEGYMSRAQGLIEKSRKEGYGSLVLGRRGHSTVLEFFIGRVGRKVVEMSDSLAVWIMN
ncbi:MAG: universal stress protein [Proteobacteria bacterium]|nr:universal stress protein [Pseudomonadota bacterium]